VLYLSQPGDTPKHTGSFESIDAINKALRNPTNEQEMRLAYAEAQARVSRLVAQKGRAEVIGWLQDGLPSAIVSED
jgi:hypothetical protein